MTLEGMRTRDMICAVQHMAWVRSEGLSMSSKVVLVLLCVYHSLTG
jgi:hypothetical protein